MKLFLISVCIIFAIFAIYFLIDGMKSGKDVQRWLRKVKKETGGETMKEIGRESIIIEGSTTNLQVIEFIQRWFVRAFFTLKKKKITLIWEEEE